MSVVRSRAPLRLGIAGGGTDVSPYSDIYGGCILNATINLFAHCTVKISEERNILFHAADIDEKALFSSMEEMKLNSKLVLHEAVYRRIVKDYLNGEEIYVEVTTYSDAPPGSGLGSSSTMVVAIIEAYRQLLNLPLGEYDIAKLAYDIERVDCKLDGGKQDQYAATFGGFNFMEFYQDDRVIVNPLRIRRYIISELEESLLLYYTGVSRSSAKIILDQKQSIQKDHEDSLKAMHSVKQSAYTMKESLLKGDVDGLIQEFKKSWLAKKNTSKSITNELVDRVEYVAFNNGARSLKVSGAGGGGFMMIFTDPTNKVKLKNELSKLEGQVFDVQFINEGCTSWTI